MESSDKYRHCDVKPTALVLHIEMNQSLHEELAGRD